MTEPINFQEIENMVIEKSGLGVDDAYFFEDTRSRSLWYTCLEASLEYPDCPSKRKRIADVSRGSPREMIVQVPTLPPIVSHLHHLQEDLLKIMTEGHLAMTKFTDMSEATDHFMGLNVLDIYHMEPKTTTSSGGVLFEKLPTHFTRLSAGFDRTEMNRVMVAIAELHSFVLYDHGRQLIPHFKREEPMGLITAMNDTIKFVIDKETAIFGEYTDYPFLEKVLTVEEAAMVRNPEERGMPLVVVHRDITPQSVGLLEMSTIRSIFDPCLPCVGSPAEDCAIAFALGMELPKYRTKHTYFLDRYHKKFIRNTGRKGFRVPHELSKFRMEFRRVFPYAACYAVFTLMNHAIQLRDSCSPQNTNRDGIMEEANLLLRRAARVLKTANRRYKTRDAYEAQFCPLQLPPALNQQLDDDDDNEYVSESSSGESEEDESPRPMEVKNEEDDDCVVLDHNVLESNTVLEGDEGALTGQENNTGVEAINDKIEETDEEDDKVLPDLV